MAGDAMPIVVWYQRGLLPMAELLRYVAAIGEAAAFGQVYRVRWIAGDQNAFLAGPFHPVDGGHRREQRLRIGMVWLFDEGFNRRRFDNPAKIHDDHPIRDMLDHADIMADKKIGQIKFIFQINKKINDLRLN